MSVMCPGDQGLRVVNIQEVQSVYNGNDFLFHKPEFVKSRKGDIFSLVLKNSDREILGRISFSIGNGVAQSMKSSPFGSFDLNINITKKELSYFTSKILNILKQRGVTQIKIQSFPEIYASLQSKMICDILSEKNFRTEKIKNQYLPVDHREFIDLAKSDKRRYLNKASKEGFEFRILDQSKLKEAYSLIRASWDVKGYDTSMSLSDLENEFIRFPENYIVFGLYSGRILISASICIKVNDHILYDVYHGYHLSYKKESPVVPLIQGIYHYARINNFSIIDLGTSVNKGVYNFKKNLGSLESNKYFFEIDLE